MSQRLAERWRLRLVVAVGVSIVLALGGLGRIAFDAVTEAATGGPEMVLNVAGGTCDDLVRPKTCDVPLGAQFTLAVDALDIPAVGYVFASTFIRFGPDLTYVSTSEPIEEVLWPDCIPENLKRLQQDDTSFDPFWELQNVGHGCATGAGEEAPVSMYAGTMVEIVLVCTSADSSTLVQLLPIGHPVSTTSGSAFHEPGPATIMPKLSNLQVNCGVGGPLDTPTPTFTIEPTATATATAGPVLKGNDDFGDAVVISAPLPYVNKQDIRDSSTELLEPEPCERLRESVWFSYTPAGDTILSASVEGSASVLSVYTGGSLGTLVNLACRVNSDALASVTFSANAAETYYIQVGFIAGLDPSLRAPSVAFSIQQELPPTKGNDDFSDAIVVTDPLPYSNKQNVGGAMLEAGEPGECGMTSSVWYTYTPSQDVILSLDMSESDFTAEAGIFAGSKLSSLERVSCGAGFVAKGGMTYYFQLGSAENGVSGNLAFELTGTSCRVEGCPRMALSIANGACDDPVEPSACDVVLGEKFSLNVDIRGAPPQGYVLAQSYIVLGSDLAYDFDAVSAQEEVVWPDCVVAVKGEEIEQSFQHGCLTGLIPPLASSNYVGHFLSLSVTCSLATSSTEVRLLNPNNAHRGTLGALFSIASGDQVIPDVDNLTVNCVDVAPTAVGGVALDDGLRPVVALDAEAGGGPAGWLVAGSVAITAALAAAAAAVVWKRSST